MKKYILLLVICVLSLFLVSCEDNGGNIDVYEIDSNITQKYDISDLNDYFEGKNANESVFTASFQNIYFNDVNQHFPIEVIRPEGYSIYAVNQGGYYYVFWSQMHISKQNLAKDNPFVYFTAYLPSSKDLSLFESLKVGISTAEDVKEIDPSFELSFVMSSGIFSHSFIDDERVLEIQYSANKKLGGYDDLIVKEITVTSRNNTSSRYGTILSMDLPS